MRIDVDEEKCTGCGKCEQICPKGGKIWHINKTAHASDLEYCHVCTLCAGICPVGAIRVLRDTDVEKEKENQKE
ncbi:indolepyruvate ferredoxin oxidoreductase subunit alpha [Methanobacterium alcaliphilum]|uniref:indolepyruvate ferredoxin oxidoreductase subunit alpha n=1 Tax=Methanobacterium alcaliphilum TaxID=392018 RepID=UPI00200A6DEB|nr:ferredoxin family protein [Methanobacterium alcaliphilum]MCK9152379.1 ferredoxin family protein [Methanobacterium alcaliphilum]